MVLSPGLAPNEKILSPSNGYTTYFQLLKDRILSIKTCFWALGRAKIKKMRTIARISLHGNPTSPKDSYFRTNTIPHGNHIDTKNGRNNGNSLETDLESCRSLCFYHYWLDRLSELPA